MAKDNNRSSSTKAFNRSDESRRGGSSPMANPPASRLSSSSSASATATAAPPVFTHEKIAERAKAIWKAKGCPAGRDRENWLEAEAQLRKEMNAR